MLGTFDLKYLLIGNALSFADLRLQEHLAKPIAGFGLPGGRNLDPEEKVAQDLVKYISDIIPMCDGQELEPVVDKLNRLKNVIVTASMRTPLDGRFLQTSDVLRDLEHIRDDFMGHLRCKAFYHIRRDLVAYYSQEELFGPTVYRKFGKAREDIERAGNCLALGEPTACVLHLMRALEAVIARLAAKLKVPIDPRDTWGTILGKMDAAIKALPHATATQQRKKDLWSECRANLFHVKNAWRDPSMHPRRNYDEKQATQILTAVRAFLEQLAKL
jgi:hypothetical protein